MHTNSRDLPEARAANLAQWNRIYPWLHSHTNWRLSELSVLLDEIKKQSDYDRYYIFTSHFTLGFCLSHQSPFHVRARVEAAAQGHRSTIELLLQRGANIHQQTDLGESVADIADLKGHTDLATYLRERIAGANRI